ncbi:non-ribosomal peptide synthetase, partial [Spongiimicrobium salis]|uniref:non-ribosomal peptide synthetase n=1 Tax=Spongiimicrobium salis TaxID=1667022 RepID=UPI00374D4430
MNEVLDLFIELNKKGITIKENGERVKLTGNLDSLTETDVQEIKRLKSSILTFIEQNKSDKESFAQIPVVPKSSNYILSSAQKRLWILSQFKEGNIAYNIPGVMLFEGNLHIKALKNAFQKLIERHEILRTTFKENEDGEVRQYIAAPDDSGFKLLETDLRNMEKQEMKVRSLVDRETALPFDLYNGPLLRAGIYRLSSDSWLFTYTMHHIISDGWSSNIFVKELLSFYSSFVKGEENTLPTKRIQYKDYVVWQQNQLVQHSLEIHKNYWLKQFSGEIPVLELPTDYRRPSIKTYNGAILYHTLPFDLSQNLIKLCRDKESTLFMGLLAIVKLLLYRYTAQEDIIVGSSVAGREHIDLEDQIGFYINTLALRTIFNGSSNFEDLLSNVREVSLGAFEHQSYPFDELVDQLDLQRDMSRNALFDVMVVLQNNNDIKAEENTDVLEGLKVIPYNDGKNYTSKFDLSFEFREVDDGIEMSIMYNSDIYDRSRIERMLGHFERLIRSVIENPSLPLYRLEYLGSEERRELLETFNDTAADYPRERTIIDLFEEQVDKRPEGTALVFGDKKITYRELNESSNRMARYLRDRHGIGKEDMVGICLERSDWMVVCILGILKAGGAYVPIDPDYPEDRIRYMLEDSACKVLIDSGELSLCREELGSLSGENLPSVVGPKNLAYVIYTSGSTGKPKGVMIEHRSVVNLAFAQQSMFNINANSKILQYATYVFDASVWEIFSTLLFGAELSILPIEAKRDTYLLSDYVKERYIDMVTLPPALLEVMEFNELPNLNNLIVAGETCPENLMEKWGEGRNLTNAYGPTEVTVCATIKLYRKEILNTNIGSPISNTRIYILGMGDSLCPIGVVG